MLRKKNAWGYYDGVFTKEKNDDLFNRWLRIINICYDKEHKYYCWFGARGYTVCDRWKSSFELFRLDMGYCPKGYCISVIDINKGYTPENCKWAKVL